MRRITTIVAVVAAAAAAVIVAPAAAQAADGYVYAWQHVSRGGDMCRWSGNDDDWSSCRGRIFAGNMRNRASSLWNNGYPGAYDDVNFYYGRWYSGAWDCLGVGDAWGNLTRQRFVYGRGKPGYGQSTNDNIASHKWVNYCGQP